MLKTLFEGPILVRSRTSVRGRGVPGSLRGLTSLQGITGNTQVRVRTQKNNYNLTAHVSFSSLQVRNHLNVIYVDDSSQDQTI